MNDFFSEWLNCGTLFSGEGDSLILGWGERQWVPGPDDSRPSFYFPDFFLKDSAPWFIQEHTTELKLSELINFCSQIATPPRKNHPWNTPHEQLFCEVFQDLQVDIAAGSLAKGVPFIIESVPMSMDHGQLIRSLKAILNYALHHPARLYGFWDKQEGMLGATPEILFRHEKNKQLETVACAGTKNIHEDQHLFLSDSKELFEHELVVKGITESLSPYGKVAVGDLQLLKLPKLMHLVTPLTVNLDDDVPFQEIVQALHPTPALGAFPKKEGVDWLEKLQNRIDRVRYGAPVGFLMPEKKVSHCYVAIRNVQWNDEGMQIAAGCGVVADSRFEKEWAEIQLKLKAIKEMLAL
jgi:menaquinone-specific isochorismate synthase